MDAALTGGIIGGGIIVFCIVFKMLYDRVIEKMAKRPFVQNG